MRALSRKKFPAAGLPIGWDGPFPPRVIDKRSGPPGASFGDDGTERSRTARGRRVNDRPFFLSLVGVGVCARRVVPFVSRGVEWHARCDGRRTQDATEPSLVSRLLLLTRGAESPPPRTMRPDGPTWYCTACNIRHGLCAEQGTAQAPRVSTGRLSMSCGAKGRDDRSSRPPLRLPSTPSDGLQQWREQG